MLEGGGEGQACVRAEHGSEKRKRRCLLWNCVKLLRHCYLLYSKTLLPLLACFKTAYILASAALYAGALTLLVVGARHTIDDGPAVAAVGGMHDQKGSSSWDREEA